MLVALYAVVVVEIQVELAVEECVQDVLMILHAVIGRYEYEKFFREVFRVVVLMKI